MKSHFDAYCKTVLERTGVNSMDVLHTLDENQLSLKKISTWDFSALYTSLPHAKLKLQLHDLLERVFTTRGKSFIATNCYHTFWMNDRKSTKYTYFTCRQLCLAVDFLIDNIISTSALETQFFGKLLVYQWVLTVRLYWLTCFSTLSSTISCLKL